MRTKLRRFLSGVTVVSMLLMLLAPMQVVGAVTASFPDLEGHWAAGYINKWNGLGLVGGYPDGTFGPSRLMTRAEFITYVNRAFNYTKGAEIDFPDVKSGDWFYGDVAKGIAMGYVTGNEEGTFQPNEPISRLEAASILYKVLRLVPVDEDHLAEYKDVDAFAEADRGMVNSIVAGKYFGGYEDKTLRMESTISRAEMIVILARAAGEIMNVADATFGPEEGTQTISGNATINKAGITLQNTVVKGDLYITEGVGEGDFYLHNVTVEGRTIVAGGGSHSGHVTGTSQLAHVIITYPDGSTHVVFADDASVGAVEFRSPGSVDTSESSSEHRPSVNISAAVPPGSTITIVGDFEDIMVDAPDVSVDIAEGSSASSVNVSENAAGSSVNVGGQVEQLQTSAPINVSIVSGGSLASVLIDEKAEGTDIQKDDDVETPKVKAPEDTDWSKNWEDDQPSTPPPSSDDDEPAWVSVTGVSVDEDLWFEKVGGTYTIDVTVSPANASNKRVTWESSNPTVATVEDGVVTMVGPGTATITATSVANNNKKATVQVIVGDLLVPPHLTIQEVIDVATADQVIVVAPGIYEEQLTIDDRPLTLLGVNTTLKGTITITANDVTVEGFKVVAPSDFTSAPVIHIIDADNVNILRNDVSANYQVTAQPAIGTSTGPARVTGRIAGNTVSGAIGVGTDGALEVVDNVVKAAMHEGIWFSPVEPEAELTVKGNEVTAGDGYSQIKVMTPPLSINEETDVLEMFASITDENQDASVAFGWAITENIQAAVNAAQSGDTIIVAPGTYAGNLVIDVENLTLQSLGRHGAVIRTEAGFSAGNGYGGITVLADGVTIDGFRIEQGVAHAVVHTRNSHDVTISNNQVVGLNDAAPRGIDVGYASAASNNVAIEGNKFEGLYCGVYVNQGTVLTIDNNEFEVMVDGAVVFDGTWPIGDVAVTNNTATDAGYLLYFYGNADAIDVANNTLVNTELANWAVYNSTLKKFFSTIQAAIDDAEAGDTIKVAAGTLDEYLQINKSLHLIGEDKETTFLTNSHGQETVLFIGASKGMVIEGGLTIQGFTFLGHENLTGDQSLIQMRASGTESDHILIQDNVFDGLGFAEGRGMGITTPAVINSGAYVEVKNNNFVNIDRYGMFLNTLKQAVVSDNTITNAGIGALILNTSGVDQLHDVVIENNVITNASKNVKTHGGSDSTGNPWFAALNVSTAAYNIEIRNNQLLDSQNYGLVIHDRGNPAGDEPALSGMVIEGNIIAGSDMAGMYIYAVDLSWWSGEFASITGNEFSDNATNVIDDSGQMDFSV